MDSLIYALVFMPVAGAVISYLTGRRNKKYRDYFVSAVTILEFVVAVILLFQYGAGGRTENMTELSGICGMGFSFTVDGFRAVYACIAAFMWMGTSLFSMEYFGHYRNRNRYYLFQLITLGATEAVFLSADLYTTFVFFEVMSFASYVWVAQDERWESLRAAATYLAVAVIGGLVMLMGLFLLYHQAGTLRIDELHEACQGKNVYGAALCMLFGFGAKAGVFPLHIWLPKAHPVAPAPASALLSGILTKTGIFGVLVISCKIFLHDGVWGTLVLMLGVLTMAAGAVLALFSIDFKRTLACSSVSQIGFIMVGIGMQGLLGEENALAVRGSFLHMVNHSLFKLVLFMVAGVIYMNLHKLDLNEIRGFGRKKPLLAFIYLMGALGIGGMPLWSGYVSKTLLHESIVEYTEILAENPAEMFGLTAAAGTMKAIEWVFLISGGLTAAYMTKLFIAVFVEKNRDAALQEKYDAQKKYMTPLSGGVLLAGSLLFPVMGVFPGLIMDKLADLGQGFMGLSEFGERVSYFSFGNLKGGLTSLAIGAALYLVIGRGWMMKRADTAAGDDAYNEEAFRAEKGIADGAGIFPAENIGAVSAFLKLRDGGSVYVDRWPKFLDLEEYLYRPVLLVILPAVCGRICGILDKATDVTAKFLIKAGSVIAGLLDTLVDALVVILRKTVYRDYSKMGELKEGNGFTYVLGSMANILCRIMNRTFWRKHPKEEDYRHKLALAYWRIRETSYLITRSLSYGLILFSIGLCATLIYLLIGAFR